MYTVGAFEAKTHFSALLERAEHGEEVFITRRGKIVARLAPIEIHTDNTKAQAAATAIRSLRKSLVNAGSLAEWMSYRNEGRP